MDFLRKLTNINSSGPLPVDTILCTMDVSALYTNIPHVDGISACRELLESTASPDSPSASFLCTLVNLILTLNFFQFNSKFWLQIHGTAMGTCMAPSYANIFMGWLEEKFLATVLFKPLLWLRYIDDIFLIWTHGKDRLIEFIAAANSFHPTIKFSSDFSHSQIPFLDVMVSLKNGLLETDLYSKPTDTFNYLHWSSCHPSHTKKSIPYGLAFRLVRICSNVDTLNSRLAQLKEHLIGRGFPERIIDSSFTRALQIPRNEALNRSSKRSSKNDRIPLVVTYNPALPDLHKIIHTYFPILHTSDRCKQAIPLPPLVSFR
jgi:hypothetical protein